MMKRPILPFASLPFARHAAWLSAPVCAADRCLLAQRASMGNAGKRSSIRRHGRIATCLMALPQLLVSVQVMAQSGPDEGQGRETAFEAVRGPVQESVSGGALLLAAYAVVWFALLAFVLRLHRIQRDNQSRLVQLEQQILVASSTHQGQEPENRA